MKPKIILHVGTEKTGTTSIQSLLSTSYDELVNSGVLFPNTIGSPCHINFTTCVLGDEPDHPLRVLLGLQDENEFNNFVAETKAKLSEEIEQTSPSIIVISDEHINSHLSSAKKLRNFKELCEEFGEIHSVIIYLRRQDKFRLSLFSEAVRAGNLSNFDINNPLPVFEVIPYRLNYQAVLENLSNAFGKNVVKVRIYDRSLFVDGDICRDFLANSGINLNYESAVKSDKNRTIDGRIIKRIAEIALKIKELNNQEHAVLLRSIINNCNKIFSGSGPVLRKQLHHDFLDQFAMHNKFIKDKYFMNNKQDELFPNDTGSVESGDRLYPDCTISWEEFFIKYVTDTGAENVNSNPQS